MSTTAPFFDPASAPIYMEETPTSGTNQATGSGLGSGSDLSSITAVDLDDPNLLLGEFDANVDLNAYDSPPPPPDGFWQAKIKQIDLKGPNGEARKYKASKNKDGVPYAWVALEATLIDPSGKFDNIRVFDRFVSTLPNKRTGAVPIIRILSSLGVKLPARVNAQQLVDAFGKALASEPIIEIETAWEGNLDQTDQKQFEEAGEKYYGPRGMERFPMGANGQRSTKMEVDTKLGKKWLQAQARIINYHAKGTNKK